MRDPIYVRQKIGRDIFDYQQLVACLAHLSKPRDKIARLVASGQIVRIKKGLYVFGEAYRRGPLNRELLANLIYGPSYISLDYALSRHGLIPERVETVTSVTTGRSRSYETPLGTFSYRHLTRTRYAAGVTLEKTEDSSFLIASPEKALIDKVWTDNRLSGSTLAVFKDYLLQDLRIDSARLASLDLERLMVISDAFASTKIRRLTHYLQEVAESRHA